MAPIFSRFAVFWIAASLLIPAASAAAAPQPGDVYREYYSYGGNWRVTDRATSHTSEYPNSTYYIDIDDIEGAVRAEALVVRWGGHTGTSRRRIAFGYTNSDNLATFNTIPAAAWVALPEIAAGVCYMHFDNPVATVPLSHLKTGRNSFVLDCGPQICHSFNWGQWGFHGMVLRIYYDPATKAHPTGSIVTPTGGVTLVESPTLMASVVGDVDRVDFIGWYEGLDLDGDGLYADWHEFWYRPNGQSSTPPAVQGHIGTATAAPWQVTWNTSYVPDQFGNQMKVLARIRRTNGLWYVTPAVTGLDLHRPGETLTLYKPTGVPTNFWVRAGQTKQCTLSISSLDNLADALSGGLHWRTWAENVAQVTINGASTQSTGGSGHDYHYATNPVALSLFNNGANTVRVTNSSEHHGCEIR